MKDKKNLIEDIEKRISAFVEELKANSNPGTELSPLLDQIKSMKLKLEKGYKEICDDIEKEIYVLMDQIGERKIKACKMDAELLEEELKGNHPYCSIYSKVPPIHENRSDPKFEEFLSKYKEGVENSQEISQYTFQVSRLMTLQKVLDDSYSDVMIMDYLMNRLGDLIASYKLIKTPKLQKGYQEKCCNFHKIQQIVDQKESEIEKEMSKFRKVYENSSCTVSKQFSSQKRITDSDLAKETLEKD